MSRYTLKIADRSYTAEVKEITADRAVILVDDVEYTVDLVELGRHPAPAVPLRATEPRAESPAAVRKHRPAAPPAGGGAVVAPLPGLILKLEVSEGRQVDAGQCLLIMEAMKMENRITAPHNGTVRKIFVSEGDSVGEGDALVEIARPEMTTL